MKRAKKNGMSITRRRRRIISSMSSMHSGRSRRAAHPVRRRRARPDRSPPGPPLRPRLRPRPAGTWWTRRPAAVPREPAHRGKLVEEAVFGSEDDRGAQDHGIRHRLQNRCLARRLGFSVGRGAVLVCTDCRDMNQAGNTFLGGDARDPPCPIRLACLEGVPTSPPTTRPRSSRPRRHRRSPRGSRHRRGCCTARVRPGRQQPYGLTNIASFGRRQATRTRQPIRAMRCAM